MNDWFKNNGWWILCVAIFVLFFSGFIAGYKTNQGSSDKKNLKLTNTIIGLSISKEKLGESNRAIESTNKRLAESVEQRQIFIDRAKTTIGEIQSGNTESDKDLQSIIDGMRELDKLFESIQ